MGAINFRDGYEFDPESYASGGGLSGMLRRALQEQSLLRQGVDLSSTPNGAADYDPDNYGSPQGGLLGRLLSVQAEQGRYQPLPEDTRSAPFAPRDSNFRQLSRISAAGASPATDPGLLDTYEDTITARRIAPSTIPVGWRARGTSIRAPSSGPASAPSIPMPTILDWWNTAAKVGQLLYRGKYGNAGDGRGAYGRCIRASGGSVDDWENFCRFLGRGENNTVGGESQNRACWGKTFESENEKRQWCENQFGNL